MKRNWLVVRSLIECLNSDRERERSSIYVSYLDHLKKRTGLILTLEQ